jgi:hypothetical protein
MAILSRKERRARNPACGLSRFDDFPELRVGLNRRSRRRSMLEEEGPMAAPRWLATLTAGGLLVAAVSWPARAPARRVTVEGRVWAQGCGVAGVGVTDGVTLVRTAPDGSFRIESRTDRRVLRLCGPNGERLRCVAGLSHRLVKRLPAGARDVQVRFDLGGVRMAR